MAFSLTGKLPLGKLSFQKMYIWEITALEIAHLGSCHLGNCPLGSCTLKMSLGKYITLLQLEIKFLLLTRIKLSFY